MIRWNIFLPVATRVDLFVLKEAIIKKQWSDRWSAQTSVHAFINLFDEA